MARTNGEQVKAEALLRAALDCAQEKWHERLVAAYALGSLAHGGFSAVSDVDMGLVLRDPLLGADAEGVAELVTSIKSTGKPFADRLSVFWGSVASLSNIAPGGRFPPLDRLDLIEYGRLLTGKDVRGRLVLPTREELVLAGAEFALRRLGNDEVIEKLKNPEALARSGAKAVTKIVLYPARFMFTAQTGEVGRNEAAVEHFVAARDGAASKLLRLALEWRNADEEGLNSDAIHALRAGVLPLYQEFLLDHERRLREYKKPVLADAFQKWGQKLQA